MVFHRKADPKPPEIPTQLRPEGQGLGGPFASRSNGQEHPPASESVIGNDLTIEGQSITIRCKGSLRVNGNIQADVHSMELIVGETANINGSVAADSVKVFGRVTGAILGSNVVLHSTAQVEGDIHSRMLSIEQGAGFDGRSRRVTDPAEIAPQLESGGRAPSVLYS